MQPDRAIFHDYDRITFGLKVEILYFKWQQNPVNYILRPLGEARMVLGSFCDV